MEGAQETALDLAVEGGARTLWSYKNELCNQKMQARAPDLSFTNCYLTIPSLFPDLDTWDNSSSCPEVGRIMGATQWSTKDLADARNMVAFFGWGKEPRTAFCVL